MAVVDDAVAVVWKRVSRKARESEWINNENLPRDDNDGGGGIQASEP